jgi:hypothetical protein
LKTKKNGHKKDTNDGRARDIISQPEAVRIHYSPFPIFPIHSPAFASFAFFAANDLRVVFSVISPFPERHPATSSAGKKVLL